MPDDLDELADMSYTDEEIAEQEDFEIYEVMLISLEEGIY